ncbi:MAG: hypothetical protein KGN02_13560 [bacterium]|nr:hypothetical protein [bacterium]
MRLVREIYDFITGGSFVTPVGLALALLAVLLLPHFRLESFVLVIIATVVASTFERIA